MTTRRSGHALVNDQNKILSVGYNGMPTGCHDDDMPWEREGEPLDTKYFYVCHAELNAILNYGEAPSWSESLRHFISVQ